MSERPTPEQIIGRAQLTDLHEHGYVVGNHVESRGRVHVDPVADAFTQGWNAAIAALSLIGSHDLTPDSTTCWKCRASHE